MGPSTVDRRALVRNLHEINIDAAASLLRRIKNDLIGHEARKAEYLQAGLLPSLAHILQTAQASVKQDHPVLARIWTETAYLTAIVAHQGPAYVQPILESKVLPILVTRIASATSPRECLIILKCLTATVDNLPPVETGIWTRDPRLADLLFASSSLDTVIDAIATNKATLLSQQLCDQAIALLCKSCVTEQHKRLLIDKGFLRVLAGRLASFIVSEGLVVPSLEALDFPSTASSGLPEPLPRNAHLSPVLEGLALLIKQSKEQAEALLSDPSLIQVLPQPRDDFSSTELRHAPWMTSHLPTTFPRSRAKNAFDGLLPKVPPKEKSTSSSNLDFPPLGAGLPGPRRRPSVQPVPSHAATLALGQQSQDEGEESTLVSFLLYIARQSRGRRRLAACNLLVSFLEFDLISTSRAKSFSSLVVPVVVAMLDQCNSEATTTAERADSSCSGLHYSKAAPGILASLIMDDPEMQKVAVEVKSINKLASGLRQTFETPSGRKVALWKPEKVKAQVMHQDSLDCVVGSGGPSLAMRHDMAHRGGTLQALAAIAPFDDTYRKEICDQGVLQQIMLSLVPCQSDQATPGGKHSGMEGNSASTILAACGAVRALTRSVTVLRTKLVDADVAKAIVKLMDMPDAEVRIAATKVLINLAMDFSPMKESVSEAAVVKKLCEQAHSANARLRLESIWALKQIVYNAGKKLKQEIINELGPSWIKLLIKTDPYDITAGEVIGLVDKDYPPQTSLDAMSGVTRSSEDIVMSEDSDGDQSVHFADASSELEPESDFNKHTPEEDLAIQEQLLDLLRNSFCGDNASDLVDYVLAEIDKEEFFKIMLTRTRPRTQMGATRKDNQVIPPPTGIVVKVLYIILHIAACNQKWRMTIAHEHQILKQVASFSSHTEPEVRAQCCWLAINLLFEDETSDRMSCRKRAQEMQRIGYAANIKKLENDPDSNVRERAKTAIHLFASLLEGR